MFHHEGHEEHEEEKERESLLAYRFPLQSGRPQIELAPQYSLRLRAFACNRLGRTPQVS